MNLRGLSLLLFLVLVFSSTLVGGSISYGNETGDEKKYVPNEVLVKFKSWVDEAEKESVRKSLGAH